MERTRVRPLTTGEISKAKGLALFTTLTATCFGIAFLLKPIVTLLGIGAVPLVVAYPLFKRFFSHPQLMLGVTFNYGVWMGYAAIQNGISWPV